MIAVIAVGMVLVVLVVVVVVAAVVVVARLLLMPALCVRRVGGERDPLGQNRMPDIHLVVNLEP